MNIIILSRTAWVATCLLASFSVTAFGPSHVACGYLSRVQGPLQSALTTSRLLSSEVAVEESVDTSKAEAGGLVKGAVKNKSKMKKRHVRKPASARRNNTKKNTKKNGNSKSRAMSNTPIHPLTDLKLGSTVEGVVAAFTDFGVFIKLNYDIKGKGKKSKGGYALLHKSQIRDEPVVDVQKLFRIGNVVKGLRVVTINYDKGEVGLSLRKQRQKRKSLNKYKVGQEYEGKVVRVMDYGAFVDVGAKNNVLLHISRISQKKILNIRNWLNEGDDVKIRIIGKDEKKQTMAASMLDSEADEYLDRRSEQLKKMNDRKRKGTNGEDAKGGMEAARDTELKSELEYFTDAVKELENALE